jgi:hypothetical protein
MVPIEPEHEIIIKCEPCDRIRCVSANKIMSGREIDLDMNCQRSALNCAAKFVPVEKVRTHVPKAK